MEAGSVAAPSSSPLSRAREWAGEHPREIALAVLAVAAVALTAAYGLQSFGQRTVNGLVSGSYFALGAVGLTLVYGILRLVNFAHGDLLTFGAYAAFLVNVSWGLPFVVAVLAAVAATALVGVLFERIMWKPVRERGAGLLQLLLISIGLAFVLRNGIQIFSGTQVRSFDVNVTDAVSFVGLRAGRTELIVMGVGFAVLIAVAVMLRSTSLGRQMRALADNFDLAETTGIDTQRVVYVTWIFGAGLAGLAGVLVVAATGALTPNTGFFLLLTLFAAVVLGGIGNAYGALAGGIVLGLAQEWSTLLVDARWKAAVGFAVLIAVLIVRPQGIFGRERSL